MENILLIIMKRKEVRHEVGCLCVESKDKNNIQGLRMNFVV